MRDNLWLFIVVGKAALITILGYVALLLGVVAVLGFKIAVAPDERQILRAVTLFLTVFLPIGIASWWIFRRLQVRYTRREARAAATAYGVFTPVSLLVATVLSQVPAGYATFLGRPFILIGAFAVIVVTTTTLNFLVCLFTLRFTGHIVKLESKQ